MKIQWSSRRALVCPLLSTLGPKNIDPEIINVIPSGQKKGSQQQDKKFQTEKKITIPGTVDGSVFALSARHSKLPGADPDGAPLRG